MGLFVVCRDVEYQSRGYETGTFWDERTFAGIRDVSGPRRGVCETLDRDHRVEKFLQSTVLRCLDWRGGDHLLG